MADTTPTLREALAAEQAEPVAWRYRYSARARWNYADGPANDPAVQEEPLYAAPPAPAAEQAEPVAPHLSYPHITQPYTLEEIRAQIASHDYSAELLLQHAMLLLEAAEQAAPVTAMIGKCQQCGHEHEIPPAPAAAEQAEPVAWRYRYSARARWNYADGPANDPAVQEEPLYAAPPAPARQEWQPIETAPRDGFMLVHEDGAIRALLRANGVWHKCGYPALIASPWGDALVGEDARRLLPSGFRLEIRDGCCENPTHWMPLPAAPLTAAPAEGGA